MKLPFARLIIAAACVVASLAQAAQSTPTKLYSLSAPALEAARERSQKNDPALQAALGKLRREADAALKLKPLSVMNKSRVPPSGDKHDYISQAPYFWPDPAKPDGLPYIRRDGDRNPEAQEGTDRPALGKLVDAVHTLSLAYYFTQHEPYATQAARLLRVWFLDPETRMNPHLEYGQGIPGINTGRGIGIIETSHFGDLCDDLGLLAGSPAWTKDDAAAFHAWLIPYFTWLISSKKGNDEAAAENNHGSWYDVQAAHLALFLGERGFARKILADGLTKRLDVQIEPDGAQPRELARTKSLSYSLMNLEALFRLARLGEVVGIDWWNHEGPDGRGLRRALEYLTPYVDPAKPWPQKDLVEGDRNKIVMLLALAQPHWDVPQH
jgi:hypothetical protein